MDHSFMARAIQLSIDNVRSGNGGPFGAIVVQQGHVVAEGVNRVTASNDPTAHAEVIAIREACHRLQVFQLKDCELYTSCEPCPMCLGAIYWAHISRVYYGSVAADAAKIGFDDSMIYQEFTKPPAGRRIPMVQMMHKEALAGFQAWEAQADKVRY